MKEKTSLDYYNPSGPSQMTESIYTNEFKPSGILDFNRSKYKWAHSLYKLMQANTWFPNEVDTSEEKKNFNALTDNEQWIYKLTFAQLSANDSIQARYLCDFRTLTTNRVIEGALIYQGAQEVLHSESYAVLLDAAGNSDEVFDLHKTNDALNEKNQRIAEQFAKYINGTSDQEMLLSATASVALEGIYFLLGFSYIYTLGDKVPGARDMIKFISRDEINTHLPLFANIFKTLIKENKMNARTIDKSYEMIREAVDIELEYGRYLIEKYPIMGLTDELITMTVHNYANDRLKKIGLEPIFEQSKTTYLEQLVEKHRKFNSTRTNFFEGNVTNYAKNSIDLDDF